jgi:hypothetical protein
VLLQGKYHPRMHAAIKPLGSLQLFDTLHNLIDEETRNNSDTNVLNVLVQSGLYWHISYE